jgi:hypothetical protein
MSLAQFVHASDAPRCPHGTTARQPGPRRQLGGIHVAVTSTGRHVPASPQELDALRRFPIKGGPPQARPRRLMSCTEAASKPTTAVPRRVMNAKRSERAPSRSASSTKPRQELRRFPATRRRHRVNPKVRRAKLAAPTRRHEPPVGTSLSAPPFGSRHTPWTHDAPPEMRPADICNPHFKDEHPESARLRRLLAVNDAIHVTPPASPDWNHDHDHLFGNRGSGPAATLTSPSPSNLGRSPPVVGWPRPLSPPPREERRMPRPEMPSAIG